MLFNSLEYILIFLPAAFLLYFLAIRFGSATSARFLLVVASLAFYSWWGWRSLPVILLSIVVNFAIGSSLGHISATRQRARKSLLIVGVTFNVALLGYFKYTNFMIDIANDASGSSIAVRDIALPLALSFVTFQKIAYLVDSYKYLTKGYNAIDYSLFATFFPQLIAGPIVHHKDIIPQFRDASLWRPLTDNIVQALCLFGIGLFKKVILADSFAITANQGFSAGVALGPLDAWMASLSYTFQLYFDFSGYVDMALGSALLFNVKLPINFNSPYQALDIQDFWRRWHVTLSNFLRDYLYIPLGGNRKGSARTYLNLFVTFLIGGLWHGASWMFVIWGALHGAALVVNRLWQHLGFRLPAAAAWALLFLFVNVAWVVFRAESMDSAANILMGMIGLNRDAVPIQLEHWSPYLVVLGAGVCVSMPNALTVVRAHHKNVLFVGGCGVVFACAMLVMTSATTLPTEFLYFNF